jgi:hypothetical protein
MYKNNKKCSSLFVSLKSPVLVLYVSYYTWNKKGNRIVNFYNNNKKKYSKRIRKREKDILLLYSLKDILPVFLYIEYLLKFNTIII